MMRISLSLILMLISIIASADSNEQEVRAQRISPQAEANIVAADIATFEAPQTMAQVQLSFSPIIKKTSPSIVNISALKLEQQRSLFFNDPFFSQFFNEFAPSSRLRKSLGSAIIIDAEKGWVMTNNHVVGGAKEISIQINNETYPASLLWSDSLLDLAIIQFDDVPKDLQAISFGNSDRLQVGDLVLALGNPFGLGQTVTMGIVSAVDRELPGNFGRYIQTDASINPGNSGGALITADGKFIGLNTLIISRSGGSQGLGFATPSNLIADIIQQIDDKGQRQQAWFGATYQNITPELAEALGTSYKSGVVVTYIDGQSNAAKAGLKRGDIIVSVNGRSVDSASDLVLFENYIAVESQVQLVLANDEIIVFKAEAPMEIPPKNPVVIKEDGLLRGVTFVNRSPKVCHELNLSQGEGGVVIWFIDKKSIAAQMGFKIGDIVYSLNGKQLNDTADLKKLNMRKGNRWIIEYERDGKRSVVRIRY